MPREPYIYTRENVENSRGEVVDTALYRRRVDEPNESAEFRGTGTSNFGRRPTRSNIPNVSAGAPGAVRRSIRGAAGRGAARNPAMRAQIQRDRNLTRAVNRTPRRRGGR